MLQIKKIELNGEEYEIRYHFDDDKNISLWLPDGSQRKIWLNNMPLSDELFRAQIRSMKRINKST